MMENPSPSSVLFDRLIATVQNLTESVQIMEDRVARMAEQEMLRNQTAARFQDGLFYINQRAREACDDEKPIDSAWLLQTTDDILYADTRIN